MRQKSIECFIFLKCLLAIMAFEGGRISGDSYKDEVVLPNFEKYKLEIKLGIALLIMALILMVV